MWMSALIAFAHFAFAFLVVATVFYEWWAFSRTPTVAEARKLAHADLLYGVAAAGVLVAGFARALWFEKGWAYYSAQPFFHAKLLTFLAVGLLSVYPTVVMLRWRSGLKAGQAPRIDETQFRRVLLCLRMEVAGLLALLLFASLMAHGVGR
jgi:putative membrane protein